MVHRRTAGEALHRWYSSSCLEFNLQRPKRQQELSRGAALARRRLQSAAACDQYRIGQRCGAFSRSGRRRPASTSSA